MRYTDYRQVLQLAKDLLIDYRTMAQLANDLQQQLNALKGTFLDDGIQPVEHYTMDLMKKLAYTYDSCSSLVNELQVFATLLKKAKGHGVAVTDNSASGYGTHAAAAAVGFGNASASGKTDNGLVPNRQTPRNLEKTQYGLDRDRDGNFVYDSPEEMDRYLYAEQGSANPGYQGTCGLCSCANILRLAGVNATETEMIDYASKTKGVSGLFSRLCTTGSRYPGYNGGTNPRSREKILQHFGIPSGLVPIEIDSYGMPEASNLDVIAGLVSSGHGVILSVHAEVLYKNMWMGTDDYHAVVPTSVKRDSSGKLLGFYICDSNYGTTFYSADKIRRALTGAPMNVTRSVIR